MELTQQVPSLELCKQLKELGWPQDSVFWWLEDVRYVTGEGLKIDGWKVVTSEYLPTLDAPRKREQYAAPTVAELGEALPQGVHTHKDSSERWECSWENDRGDTGCTYYNNTEANVRAKVWIYLKENKLI